MRTYSKRQRIAELAYVMGLKHGYALAEAQYREILKEHGIELPKPEREKTLKNRRDY